MTALDRLAAALAEAEHNVRREDSEGRAVVIAQWIVGPGRGVVISALSSTPPGMGLDTNSEQTPAVTENDLIADQLHQLRADVALLASYFTGAPLSRPMLQLIISRAQS